VIFLVIAGAVVSSFVLSLLATRLCGALAWRVGMVDRPGLHKSHAQPTALLGGLAIFAAILLPSVAVLALAKIWAVAGPPSWLPAELAGHIPGAASKIPQALGIGLAAAWLVLLGLIDDKFHLGPWVKMMAQFVAAGFVVIFCDVRILTLIGPGLSIAASIFWLVLIMNSFNFLDNTDGLCAGVAAICAAALLGASLGMGQWFVSGWLCLVIGATLGFLVRNFPPAKIFMGDAGSLPVGFFLGVLSCLTTYLKLGPSGEIYGWLVPLMALAIPIYDTTSVIFIRLREGRNPMVGDNRHFSHRLLQRGMSKRGTLLTIYLCTAGTAIAASVLPHTTGLAPAAMLFGQTICILMIIAMLESTDKVPASEENLRKVERDD